MIESDESERARSLTNIKCILSDDLRKEIKSGIRRCMRVVINPIPQANENHETLIEKICSVKGVHKYYPVPNSRAIIVEGLTPAIFQVLSMKEIGSALLKGDDLPKDKWKEPPKIISQGKPEFTPSQIDGITGISRSDSNRSWEL